MLPTHEIVRRYKIYLNKKFKSKQSLINYLVDMRHSHRIIGIRKMINDMAKNKRYDYG